MGQKTLLHLNYWVIGYFTCMIINQIWKTSSQKKKEQTNTKKMQSVIRLQDKVKTCKKQWYVYLAQMAPLMEWIHD